MARIKFGYFDSKVANRFGLPAIPSLTGVDRFISTVRGRSKLEAALAASRFVLVVRSLKQTSSFRRLDLLLETCCEMLVAIGG